MWRGSGGDGLVLVLKHTDRGGPSRNTGPTCWPTCLQWSRCPPKSFIPGQRVGAGTGNPNSLPTHTDVRQSRSVVPGGTPPWCLRVWVCVCVRSIFTTRWMSRRSVPWWWLRKEKRRVNGVCGDTAYRWENTGPQGGASTNSGILTDKQIPDVDFDFGVNLDTE